MSGTGVVRPFTVIVGVSGVSGSPAALRWGLAEATHHAGVMIAVMSWRPGRTSDASGSGPDKRETDGSSSSGAEFDQTVAELQDLVIEAVGEGSGVECRVVRGGRRKVLRSLSRHADLLVVDAPQRTDVHSSPLFVPRLIRSSSCPVVVMPPRVAELSDTPVTAAGKRIGRSLLNAAGSAGRPGARPPHHA